MVRDGGAPGLEDHGGSAHALHQCPGRQGMASVDIAKQCGHSRVLHGQLWWWCGLGDAMEGTCGVREVVLGYLGMHRLIGEVAQLEKYFELSYFLLHA